jgi:uncharacterized protein YfiM (DUF2279 family)
MTTVLARPFVPITFGAFMVCAETCLHFESIVGLPASWFDLPIHDWLAGGFLIAAGFKSGTRPELNGPWRAAAWGFMLSLLVSALFGYLGEWWTGQVEANGWISEVWLLVILTSLTMVALVALIDTLRPSAG